MANQYTEVTSQGWISRLMGAIGGVLIGIVFCLIAVPLLFWNEGRAVRTHRGLVEGSGAVATVKPEAVDASREGKLVHLTGSATTNETLKDSDFGVSAQAIKLRRKVEIYQWKEESKSETRDKLGGGTETRTTYTYEKVWSDDPIDSTSFKQAGHTNTGKAFPDSEVTAQSVSLGAFKLSEGLINQWDKYDPVRSQPSLKGPGGTQLRQGTNGYYSGDPNKPKIGDNRITFEIVKPGLVSLVAKQHGNSFEPYQTAAGTSLEMLKVGSHSSQAMFQAAMEENTLMTWLIRGGGFLLLFFGILMIFRPLEVAADIVPLFGTLMGAGIGIFAFFTAAALSLIVIAIGWIAYRPLLGIGLLAVAALMVFAVRSMAAKRHRLSSATG